MLLARTATVDPLRALHEADRVFAGYLQAPARIESFAESRDGHAAYATFRSSLHGAPVAGVMIAAASEGSTQLVALVDRPQRLGRTFGPMLAALQTQSGGAAPGAGAADFHRFTASDNSGSVLFTVGLDDSERESGSNLRARTARPSSMAAARASQAAIDRSTSGYVHYLNGTDVVEHLGTGERGTLDGGFAQGLAREDPQNFRIVPMTQYNAGD